MRKILPLLILVIIAVAIALYYTLSVNQYSTSIASQTDFSISDTASIGKIFIADRLGNSVTLTQGEGNLWKVNGKYPARPDAIQTLLETFKNVYIQRPVPKSAQSQVNKMMAGMSNIVEIYDRDGNWIKTWYVGYGTMDKKGTYMLLETPEAGKAAEPYILDMRGFIGMLNTRFFTSESEWRSTIILRYPSLGFQVVEVFYPSQNEKSFKITYGGGNEIRVYPYGKSEPLADFDTLVVKDYLLNFKLASFENYKTGLSHAQEDSVKALIPYQIIRVTDPRGTREIKLWAKNELTGEVVEGKEMPPAIDKARVYASCDNGELALAQRFAWDKFRAPLQAFLPKQAK